MTFHRASYARRRSCAGAVVPIAATVAPYTPAMNARSSCQRWPGPARTVGRGWATTVLAGDRPDGDPCPGRDGLRRGVRPACDRSGCTPRSCRCSPTRLLGPSRILVLGPDSALLPIIAAVDRAALRRAIQVARRGPGRGCSAVLVGVIVRRSAFARLGFLTDFLSAPVRHGYLNGIALIVVVSQLPRLFGFSRPRRPVFRQVASFATGVRGGRDQRGLARDRGCLPGGDPRAARRGPGSRASSWPSWARRS